MLCLKTTHFNSSMLSYKAFKYTYVTNGFGSGFYKIDVYCLSENIQMLRNIVNSKSPSKIE